MRSKPLLQSAAAALLLGLSTAVPAGDDCDVPVDQWQSRAAVMQMAARQGWQVQRLKIDDGCYEVRGRDAKGRSFKAKLDPQTLRVVKMKSRDGDHARDRDHDRDRDQERRREPGAGTPSPASDGAAGATPSARPAPASAAAPASVLKPGTTPRATIE